jgi:hypothetical protein
LARLDSRATFNDKGKLTNYSELTSNWLTENNAAQETWN